MWVVVYYPTWAQNPLGANGLPPVDVDWRGVSHAVHFFGDDSTSLTSPYFRPAFDTAFDDEIKFGPGGGATNYQQQLLDNLHNVGGKVLVDLRDITSNALMTITANQNNLDTFADAVTSYADSRGYDGIELDWEFWSTGANPTAAQMSALINTLRNKMNIYPNLKTFIVVPGIGQSEFNRYNTAEGKGMVDMYILQMYAYSGINWSSTQSKNVTWYMNPLYIGDAYTVDSGFEGSAYDSNPRLLIFGIRGWLNNGFDPKRLGIGLPSFARFYHGTDAMLTGFTSGGDEISVPDARSQLTNGGTKSFDSQRHASRITGTAIANQGVAVAGEKFWITLPVPSDLEEDIKWARDLGLGAVMMYEISKDSIYTSPFGSRHPIMTSIIHGSRKAQMA